MAISIAEVAALHRVMVFARNAAGAVAMKLTMSLKQNATKIIANAMKR